MGHFVIENPIRHVRLGQIIDAGRAAAAIGFLQLHELHARRLTYQSAGSGRRFHHIAQMAGILVGHPDPAPRGVPPFFRLTRLTVRLMVRLAARLIIRPVARRLPQLPFRNIRKLRDSPLPHNDLADIENPFGEPGGFFLPLRIVMQQMVILDQKRAAASRVRNDVIDPGRFERPNVANRQLSGRIRFAAVGVQRAAAVLLRGNHHVETGFGQQFHRMDVGRCKQDIHNAAAEHADPGNRFPLCRIKIAQLLNHPPARSIRQNRFHLPHVPGKQPHDAKPVRQAAQAGFLIQLQSQPEPSQPALIRKEPLERQVARDAHPPPMLFRMIFDRIAGLLDQLPVFDVGRTGRLAGAASEAVIHLILERKARLHQAVDHGFHQGDPAAGRFGLDARFPERRTGREAEAAAHAVGQLIVIEL